MTNALRITGATRLYAILEDPIVQVRSPEVFTERFAAANVNGELEIATPLLPTIA